MNPRYFWGRTFSSGPMHAPHIIDRIKMRHVCRAGYVNPSLATPVTPIHFSMGFACKRCLRLEVAL